MLPRDEQQLADRIARVLNDWPSAGLAVAVVRDGSPTWFHSHGVADVATGRPVTENTVFRIASLTKTITAVAVLQLWEQGLVDLDAPANTYLRTFQLVPTRAGLAPATVRHLLTHTAGIGYWRRWSDLARPGVGSGVSGRSVPSLADYYRGGLPVEIEPGTKWAYSNHGFATLGQIVEDVTGEPYDRYLRAHLFEPLGMEHADLARSERVTPSFAIGYVLGRRGLRPAPDREVPLAASGGVYATIGDMAGYVAALLQGGTGEHGMVLKPETVAMMFAPQFQVDPRVPGMGLGFELGDEDGHRTATKSGTMSGFLSHITLAPDDGIGIVVLTNTGNLNGRGATDPLGSVLIRHLLGLPDPTRAGLPPRPEVWRELCGWYGMDPGPMTNLFNRLVVGAGVEVAVRRGQFWFRPLSAIPTMRRGFPLHPDAEDDPYVFRLDLTELGIGTLRVAFCPHTEAGRTHCRLDAGFVSLQQRPDVQNPKLWLAGGLSAGAVALALDRAGRVIRTRRGG